MYYFEAETKPGKKFKKYKDIVSRIICMCNYFVYQNINDFSKILHKFQHDIVIMLLLITVYMRLYAYNFYRTLSKILGT